MRHLVGIFVSVCLTFVCICNDAGAQQKTIPLPQITPPKILDYTPRKTSFSLPQYYYPCRQVFNNFPNGDDFSRTTETKKNLHSELDFIYSNGDSVPNKLHVIYNSLVDNIAAELQVAPKSKMELAIILNFEKSMLSMEECGRALGTWEASAPKLKGAFGDYYSRSQNEFKEEFQTISQSKFSRSTLLLNEAFLNDFRRSNFISLELSTSLTPDIEAANSRLVAARSQYLGTYFAAGIVDKNQCVIEDEEIKLRGRINAERLYPRVALSKNIEGEVTVRLNIDSNGKASGVEFASVSHEDLRSEAILTAFRNASFWPQIKDCAAAAATGNQKLSFRIGY